MTPQQEKAFSIASTIANAALSISRTVSAPIPNSRLLKKRPFGERNKPHRIVRKLKREARAAIAQRGLFLILTAASSAAQTAAIIAQPIPKYPQGGS